MHSPVCGQLGLGQSYAYAQACESSGSASWFFDMTDNAMEHVYLWLHMTAYMLIMYTIIHDGVARLCISDRLP